MKNALFTSKLSKANSIKALITLRDEISSTTYISKIKTKLYKKFTESKSYVKYEITMNMLSKLTRLTDAGDHSFKRKLEGKTQLAKDANGRKIELYVFEKTNLGKNAVVFVKFTK